MSWAVGESQGSEKVSGVILEHGTKSHPGAWYKESSWSMVQRVILEHATKSHPGAWYKESSWSMVPSGLRKQEVRSASCQHCSKNQASNKRDVGGADMGGACMGGAGMKPLAIGHGFHRGMVITGLHMGT